MARARRTEKGITIGAGTTSGGVDLVELEGGGVAPASGFTNPREGGQTVPRPESPDAMSRGIDGNLSLDPTKGEMEDFPTINSESISDLDELSQNVPAIVGDEGGAVGGSRDVRQEQDAISNMIDRIMDSIEIGDTAIEAMLGAEPFGQTEQGQEDLSEIRALAKGMGALTNQDVIDIDEAGRAAGFAFDPLISEAAEQKRLGLPKALIRAGEAGGLLSTQFAGIAAVMPVEGEDFFGAGGRLDQVRSTYDRNISDLRARKQQAVLAARQASRQAKLTQRQQDFNNATTLFEVARQAHNEALNLVNEKLTVLSNLQNISQSRQAAGREAMAFPLQQAKREFDIVSQLPEGETMELGGQTFTGIAPPEEIEAFFSGGDIISVMKSLPEGESTTIVDPNTGAEWQIDGMADPDVVTATDNAGTITAINKNTGEVMWVVQGAGKAQKGEAPGALTGGFKFGTTAINSLIGANFTTEDINAVQENIRGGHSIEEIIEASDITPEQADALRTSFRGEEDVEEEELTDEQIEIALSAATDEDDNLNVDKIPTAQQQQILNRALELGMFEEEEGNAVREFLQGLRDKVLFTE